MSRHVYLVLALALMVAGYSHPSPGLARGKAISAPLRPVFEDGLETAMGWRVFEEVVGEDPCYGRGIGSATRSQDVAYRGDYSLLIWANQARSLKSNHLIAYKRISDHGRAGTWRYQVHAYIAPGTANAGQTGPEFSIQNTRLSPAQQLTTATAGIQYIANSESAEYGHWNLWRGVAAGSAAWQTFITQTLAADTWYTLTLEADYTNNTYQSFSLQGGSLDLAVDLATVPMADETKLFTETTFVVTAEAENRWNNCGAAGVFDYRVYYDQLQLESSEQEVFLPAVIRS